MRRVGRPGLLGAAVRTAVVAGTATAVSGAVARHQQERAAEALGSAPAAEAYVAAAPAPAPAPAAPVASAPAAPLAPAPHAAPANLVGQLQQLGELRQQGLLSDLEFEQAKSQLLRG